MFNSDQDKRNGIYTIDRSELVGERYSFTHESGENYFYYRRSSYQWWVGSTNGGSSRGIQFRDLQTSHILYDKIARLHETFSGCFIG